MEGIRKMRMCKLNNLGVSLTELIVVIAILAVLAGGSITFMGLIPRTQVNSCVQDFAVQMGKVKTHTMSFQDVRVELYQNDTGVYMQVYKGSDAQPPVQIGKGGISVKAKIGGLEQDLNGKRLELSYDRSSGSFEDARIVGGGTEGECTSITFYKAAVARTATLITLTGRISY